MINECNIKISEALNGKLPYEKVVPIEERVISVFDRIAGIGVYKIIRQIKYIFINGENRGETFFLSYEIEEILAYNSVGLSEYCYNWRIIKRNELKEIVEKV